MELTDLENQIVQILEDKYKHTIDKDDPVLLSITAQVLATEQILDEHDKLLESKYEIFKEDLDSLLKQAKIDSDESKSIISEHVRKTFLSLSESYKSHLNTEFLKAGQEYQKAQKWYKLTKFWSIGSVLAISIILILFSWMN